MPWVLGRRHGSRARRVFEGGALILRRLKLRDTGIQLHAPLLSDR